MARTVKDPEKRKKELVRAAEKLFKKKGFDNTSVNDIVREVGVSHGLFYYYFDSKEDLIDEIVEEMIKDLEEIMEKIIQKEELRADEKFREIMVHSFQMKSERQYLVKYFTKESDPRLYQKLLDESIEKTTPYLTRIVEEGIDEGIFETEYPEKTIRFWMNGRQFIDRGREKSKGVDELVEAIKAEAYFLERLLNSEKKFISSFYEKHQREIEDFISDMEKDGDQDG